MASNNQMKNAKISNQKLFDSAIKGYESRHQELDDRHQLFNNKINIMERSIPALMSLSLCQVGQDAPVQAGMKMIKKIITSMSPSPTDEFIADLTKHVEDLNHETAELHDKIINADIQLMESCMELESLELANQELEEQIKQMENRLESRLSLELINSKDRLDLARINKLGDDEIKVKRSIEELENRETTIREQVKRILDLCMNEAIPSRKHHAYKSKKPEKNERVYKSQEYNQKHTCKNAKTRIYLAHKYGCYCSQKKSEKFSSNQLQSYDCSQSKLQKES